ncbi:putative bifunctional diguanylate cyclase/phosphodiesterase [Arthrobacter sp. 35W]|uniref:putative bifunctional diguanylate cyclase/phosphodiesterase n=1 Tax=Arthrobacter sp. 35W TaxID=1132441 RepID=UPI00040F3F04|nr:bifunctional diguanylate cyclase/phosphodiesterase [Arthrobacter sp. 35W]
MTDESAASDAAALAGILTSRLAAAQERIRSLEAALAQARTTLEHQAQTDALTGAISRPALVKRLTDAMAGGTGTGTLPTVLAIGLGGRAKSNVQLGRSAGDVVLVEVAERLMALAGSEANVVRLGEEDFALLVPGHDPEQALRMGVKAVETLGRRIVVGEHVIWLEPRVGVRFGHGDLGPEEQIRDAMLAASHAGGKAGNRIQVFAPAMLERASQRVQMIADLHRAMAENELELHYQPVVELRTGRMVGAEALVRWRHPYWGRMQPADFLPAAEEGGLMVALGQWVLGHAVEQLAQWSRHLPANPRFKVHVNLSPGELGRLQLVGEVKDLLARHNVAPKRLALEITENAIVSDSGPTAKILAGLRKLGVGLEIDDFGTGYSSISYLRNLPVDTAKIDRSLVTGMEDDPRQQDFVAAILMLIKAAQLSVVAEGIETAAQAERLNAMGCELGQGYFFSKPVPADKLAKLLRRGGSLAGTAQ